MGDTAPGYRRDSSRRLWSVVDLFVVVVDTDSDFVAVAVVVVAGSIPWPPLLSKDYHWVNLPRVGKGWPSRLAGQAHSEDLNVLRKLLHWRVPCFLLHQCRTFAFPSQTSSAHC